ncbi:alpha/beta fold hydrolase [Streptomyces sp. NPDC051563]|uniref:alpha/beta fold hydrolase n=1 Tax=Streptomyces sp. NPDC051563 TaxID=3365659 RepID=UPI0037B8EE80
MGVIVIGGGAGEADGPGFGEVLRGHRRAARLTLEQPAEVSGVSAAFMADSQVPWGVDALDGAVCEPAWQTRPSWYLVATDDRMIPSAAQRALSERAGATVTETPGSHAVYVSRPAVVAAVIAQAARAAG